MDQYQVVINCRSENLISPQLLGSLTTQTHPCQIKKLESPHHPIRISNIRDHNALYFFFDEDVELPHDRYIENVAQYFAKNPQVLFASGKYLSSKNTNYLARCYNSLVTTWMMIHQRDHLLTCQNAPGGVWIISGKVIDLLQDWEEPDFWAGEDTYTIRWLQKKGVVTYYSSEADVLHRPRSHVIHFAKRAFRQGLMRTKKSLQSPERKIHWRHSLHHFSHWPGWMTHQLFVELGALYSLISSIIAKKTP